MDNKTIEATLLEIARTLELKGENPFKVRAYENAARAVASLEEDVATLIREERLKHIPGIGASIREKLLELCGTGQLAYLEELRAGIPAGVFDLMKVQGMGPKKTKAVWELLGVTSLEELEKACRDDRVAHLKGFGKKTQDKILSGLALLARTRDRVLRAEALPQARRLADALAAVEGVERVEVAGSLRRGRETVRDVDILVACPKAEPVMEAFVAHEDVADVIARGPTKTSVHVHSGLQVDVRVVPPESFACALAYFTGSKEFNVHLRQLALDQGFTLNEYSLRPLDGTPAPALATEAELFGKLGLAYVEPELRENTGEVDAARAGTLPTLVEPGDIAGVLHVHTTWSDGVGSVADMVEEAARLGYGYVGISDHSQAARYANGLSPERLRAQREEVEAARAAHPGLVVLHGVECDILSDGALDLPDDCLAELDFVIASVHTELGMDRDRMTARLVRAVSHPLVRVLGHPLGRRLLERESSQFDWEPVLEAAGHNGVAIEVNGQPQRLDADWIHIRRIRARGVKLCINPDAHAPGTLDDARRHALVEARRGWASRDDVVNSLPADRFVSEFLRRQAAPARPARARR
ncbi:MAG: DNA polymerase/3'-5' exonuclease PolX [Planctomycetes bacterium]|nr:DNA polymerase/3'-5' exonuclease PolX [Planctomycetota bacterium]